MDWVIEHITDLAKRIWMSTSKYRCRSCGFGTYRVVGERNYEWGGIAGNRWKCNRCGHAPTPQDSKKLDSL